MLNHAIAIICYNRFSCGEEVNEPKNVSNGFTKESIILGFSFWSEV